MSKVPISYDNAIHSDFLIHWTGNDIDNQLDPTWYEHHRPIPNPQATDCYLRRLRDILLHGLWMTDEGEQTFKVGENEITIPATPQCCFTELKLSESRTHARLYGRLGIGVKRPFLFQRFGRPLAYFGFGVQRHNDRFLKACFDDLRDKTLLNFFKPMNSDERRLTYDLYSESEWRVLFFDDLLRERKIIDPRDRTNTEEYAYFKSLTHEQQAKLKYLIPLDGWFAMIIYPTSAVKNGSRWETGYGITEKIRRIKSNPNDHGNKVEGLKNPVRGNWPIEVNLDDCRHF